MTHARIAVAVRAPTAASTRNGARDSPSRRRGLERDAEPLSWRHCDGFRRGSTSAAAVTASRKMPHAPTLHPEPLAGPARPPVGQVPDVPRHELGQPRQVAASSGCSSAGRPTGRSARSTAAAATPTSPTRPSSAGRDAWGSRSTLGAAELRGDARLPRAPRGAARVPRRRTSTSSPTIPRNRAEFDQVLLLDVIEHIMDAPATFRQIHDLLDEDGFVYITTPEPRLAGERRPDPRDAHRGRLARPQRLHVRAARERCWRRPASSRSTGSGSGRKGSTLVTWIQHRLFRSWIDPLTVLFFPLLKLAAVALSPSARSAHDLRAGAEAAATRA